MGVISIVNGVYKPTYNWGAPPCNYPWWIIYSCWMLNLKIINYCKISMVDNNGGFLMIRSATWDYLVIHLMVDHNPMINSGYDG